MNTAVLETDLLRTATMVTRSGRLFPLADPKPSDIDILDIAFSLSNQCRFNGHCQFYSGAQHSVHAADLITPELGLVALLHDASEAYCGDLIRPIKRMLRSFNVTIFDELEHRVWLAIAERFGLPARTRGFRGGASGPRCRA